MFSILNTLFLSRYLKLMTLHGLYIGFLLVAAVVMYRIYMKLIFRQDLMEAYMEEEESRI